MESNNSTHLVSRRELLGRSGAAALAGMLPLYLGDSVFADSEAIPRAGSTGGSRLKASSGTLPFVENSFTVVVLPDTQYYCESYPHHFLNQTAWIAANRDRRNITFVAHLGDVTNNNSPQQ